MIYNMIYGGTSSPQSKELKDINFFDYDGTIVDSYYADEWDGDMPPNPEHDGLISQGWNYTLAEIQAEVTAQGKCDIGEMYLTESGDTEVDIELLDGRTDPYLGICPNGTVTINWGDGDTDTVTGDSLTTLVNTQHSYASAGKYTISLHVDSGEFAIYTNVSTYAKLLWAYNAESTANWGYTSAIKAVRLGNDVVLGNSAFSYCMNLETITIPSGYSNFSNDSIMRECYSLKHFTIPSGITTTGTYILLHCYALKSASLPSSLTEITADMFDYCYSLKNIVIPSGAIKVSDAAFQRNTRLAKVTIPSNITRINGSAFYYAGGVKEFHLLPTTPPTISATTFQKTASDCVFYVPLASENAYKTASVWSTYASQIVGE